MCEQSSLTDPELIKLCQEIVKAQNIEIAQMQAMSAIDLGAAPSAITDCLKDLGGEARAA